MASQRFRVTNAGPKRENSWCQYLYGKSAEWWISCI